MASVTSGATGVMLAAPQRVAALGSSPGPTHSKGAATQNERIGMSKVSEMVDEEAAKAEAEPDEDEGAESEEVEGQEGEQEAPPESTPTGEPTEAQMRSLDKEQQRHEKRVHEIMGAFVAGFVACDQCDGVGLTRPVEVKTHKKYVGCETCNGFGAVLTGSRAPGNETQPCPVCAGRGFLEEMPPAPAGQPQANGEQQPGPQYGTPGWMGNPDLSAQPTYQAPVS